MTGSQFPPCWDNSVVGVEMMTGLQFPHSRVSAVVGVEMMTGLQFPHSRGSAVVGVEMMKKRIGYPGVRAEKQFLRESEALLLSCLIHSSVTVGAEMFPCTEDGASNSVTVGTESLHCAVSLHHRHLCL